HFHNCDRRQFSSSGWWNTSASSEEAGRIVSRTGRGTSTARKTGVAGAAAASPSVAVAGIGLGVGDGDRLTNAAGCVAGPVTDPASAAATVLMELPGPRRPKIARLVAPPTKTLPSATVGMANLVPGPNSSRAATCSLLYNSFPRLRAS